MKLLPPRMNPNPHIHGTTIVDLDQPSLFSPIVFIFQHGLLWCRRSKIVPICYVLWIHSFLRHVTWFKIKTRLNLEAYLHSFIKCWHFLSTYHSPFFSCFFPHDVVHHFLQHIPFWHWDFILLSNDVADLTLNKIN